MSADAIGNKQWFGHPRGLSTLFFTELWERFSYYGMRGLLILFMTKALAEGGLGFGVGKASAIYGLYTAGVYLLALPGGWIADRLIGQRRAVLVGGLIIATGHFTLAIPALWSFFTGLVLIVIGTGLLKPNVSVIVGDLYPEGGARRDAGFSVFYMGINLGAFLGPLVCGYLGENIDWHLGFSAAGVGMVFGVIQYVLGGKYLGAAGNLKPEAVAERPRAFRGFAYGLGAVVAVCALTGFAQRSGSLHLTFETVARSTGGFIVALAFAYFAYVLFFGNLDTRAKKRVLVIAVLFVASAIFWSGYEQAGSSMNLFAERLTNRVVFGWEAPASWLQSINPLFIILLAPVFGSIWLRMASNNPPIPVKFGLGLVQLGVGFAVLAWGSAFTEEGSLVSPMWLTVTYFFHTTGELCLSPVGLSSVTKLSPPRFVGQMMGIWFMGTALGNLLAGLVAGLIESLPLPQLFGTVCSITAGSGIVLLLLSRPVQKLIGEKL